MTDTAIDLLLRDAREHAAAFPGMRPVVPQRHLAIVTCMDSRINVFDIFGLDSGEAHIIRNAGGLVTDDVLRSLVISQTMLETREIIVMHHTKCGLHTADEETIRTRVRTMTGHEPPYAFGAFDDLDAAVRSALARVREHRYLPHRDRVRGFVYDVNTGDVREII